MKDDLYRPTSVATIIARMVLLVRFSRFSSSLFALSRVAFSYVIDYGVDIAQYLSTRVAEFSDNPANSHDNFLSFAVKMLYRCVFFQEPQEAFNLRYNDINKSFVLQGDLYISGGAYQLERVNLIELDVIECMNILHLITSFQIFTISAKQNSHN